MEILNTLKLMTVMNKYTTIIRTMNSRKISIEEFLQIETSGPQMPNILEFAKRYRDTFCMDVDIEFMEYFLEIAKPEMRGKFIVPHSKLYEYGITVDKQSSLVKRRIDALGLIEDTDYHSTNLLNGHGGVPKIEYTFTPKAFKNILLGATTHKKHTIDVQRYRNYYIFLEEMVGQFNECQKKRDDAEKKQLTTKVGQLSDDKKQLTSENTEFKDMMCEMKDMLQNMGRQNEELKEETKKTREEAKQAAERSEFNFQEMKKSLKQEIGHVADLLKEKCVDSIMKPANPGLVPNFVVMGWESYDDDTKKTTYHLAHIAGQATNVRRAVRAKTKDPEHTWTEQVKTHYNANPVVLRNNIKTFAKTWIGQKIVEANEFERMETIKKNNELQQEISDWNDEHKNDDDFVFRSFTLEKSVFKPMTEDTFPVKCGCTHSTFTENPYIDYDEYLQMMCSLDTMTKASPYVSDDSE